MFRVRLVCKLLCGRGLRKAKGLAPARREGRVAFLATLRLLCCYSAAQGGRRATSPAWAGRQLLCGGGLERAPAAPSCCDEAGRATLRPGALARRAGSHLFQLCGCSAAGFGHLRALAAAVGLAPSTPWTHGSNWGLSIYTVCTPLFHIRAAAAGGLTPTLHVGHLPVLEAIVGLPPSLRRNRDCAPQQRHHKGSSPRRRMEPSSLPGGAF